MTTKEEQLIITKYDLLYEQRMTKVETSLEKLEKNIDETFKELRAEIKALRSDFKTDFRWLFGILILVVGIMIKGFHWL